MQADQGLLCYWTKYVQRSVSIIVNNRIEMWGVDPSTGRLVREAKEDEEESVAASLNDWSCNQYRRRIHKKYVINKNAPYRNFVHFSGKKKPWYSDRDKLEEALRNHNSINNTSNNNQQDKVSSQPSPSLSPLELWYWLITDVLESTGFRDKVSLDFIKKETENIAPVGITPGARQRNMYIKAKSKNGWKQYENET